MILITLFLSFQAAHAAVSFDEALRAAMTKHELVAQSRERVVQAEEKYSMAKSGPQPNIAFNATHLIQPKLENPLFREFSPERQTTTNLTLMQPLFRGFREFAALRQTRNFLDATKAEQMQMLADLYEMVATAYVQILAGEQDQRNLSDQLQISSDRVKNLQARAKRGESARNEPLSAQSQQAAVDAAFQLGISQLRSARESFVYLTGLPLDSVLEERDATKEPTVKALDFYLSRLETRPDIVAAREKVEAASEGVSIAKGAHWPSADLLGNYYFQRPEGFAEELEWDITFKLTFPIYEGGLRLAETRAAASVHRDAELELARLRRSASAQIRATHESLTLRVRHLDALKRSSELSRQNSQMLERDFRRGLTRNLEVQQALTDYGNARRGYDQARYAARLDLIKLEKAANILPAIVTEQAGK